MFLGKSHNLGTVQESQTVDKIFFFIQMTLSLSGFWSDLQNIVKEFEKVKYPCAHPLLPSVQEKRQWLQNSWKKNPKRSSSGPLFDLSSLGYCWQLNIPTEGAGPLFMQKTHPKVVCIHRKIRVVFINENTLTHIISHLWHILQKDPPDPTHRMFKCCQTTFWVLQRPLNTFFFFPEKETLTSVTGM